MHLPFITTAHSSLSQRLQVELPERGHAVTVAVCADGDAMLDAAARTPCQLIVAPMLKTAVPDALWQRQPCLIVHPGIRGDRGPSSLLQAQAAMDAGPVWAWDRLQDRLEQRQADERRKPLAEYRREELTQMHLNFFGADPSYHQARSRFVHKGAPPVASPGVQAIRA